MLSDRFSRSSTARGTTTQVTPSSTTTVGSITQHANALNGPAQPPTEQIIFGPSTPTIATDITPPVYTASSTLLTGNPFGNHFAAGAPSPVHPATASAPPPHPPSPPCSTRLTTLHCHSSCFFVFDFWEFTSLFIPKTLASTPNPSALAYTEP